MTGIISVVPFKMNVLQQSTNANHNNERRDVIIIRKPSPHDDILITNTARKKAKKDVKNNQSPLPLAVARRNARERNRVKQVNNGFATLRQHIPNSIAAAFENNNGRGGNKKLSKVETLRMAVEYIRSLEDMLASDGDENIQRSTAVHDSFTYLLSPSIDDDDLSTNPTPPPQTYVRINGTNAYQMIPSHLYENSENLDPILTDPSLMDADLEFGDQDLSLLNSMETNGSLSPEMYSDHSLSPSSIETTSFEDIKILPASEDHKENMIHVMAWWEQQHQVTSES